MAIKIRREWYSTHEEFIRALARDFVDEVREISAKTGIRPQYVVNKMVATMCKTAERLHRDRKAQSN